MDLKLSWNEWRDNGYNDLNLIFFIIMNKEKKTQQKEEKKMEKTEEAVWIAKARHKCPHFSTKANRVGRRIEASLGKEFY